MDMATLLHERQRTTVQDGGHEGRAFQAEISAAPASVNAKVAFTVPGIDDGEFDQGTAPWMPRAGAAQTTPAEGDRALVVFDDTGSPWVVAWWPEGIL